MSSGPSGKSYQGRESGSRGPSREYRSRTHKENASMWGFHHVPPRITMLALLSAVIYVGAVLIAI